VRIAESLNRVAPKFRNSKGELHKNWYKCSLWDLSKKCGMESEYDLFCRRLHEVVHSTPLGIASGPPMEPGTIMLAAYILYCRLSLQVALIAEVEISDEDRAILSKFAETSLS
jgi:hypothetical protein